MGLRSLSHHPSKKAWGAAQLQGPFHTLWWIWWWGCAARECQPLHAPARDSSLLGPAWSFRPWLAPGTRIWTRRCMAWFPAQGPRWPRLPGWAGARAGQSCTGYRRAIEAQLRKVLKGLGFSRAQSPPALLTRSEVERSFSKPPVIKKK